MSFHIQTYGDLESENLLIQMIGDHDLKTINQEIKYIFELSGGKDFCLTTIRVNNWNQDLSPWQAPAVFGNEAFGKGASDTLRFLQEEIIPASVSDTVRPRRHIYIGGYSLAGLFALWAGYQTDRFDGIAAASPSIWFPSFTRYMRENKIHAEAVYLSLGDREERTKNPVMAQVGNAVRTGFDILKDDGTDCILEWNSGNHFKEPDLRTAKAFAWLMDH